MKRPIPKPIVPNASKRPVAPAAPARKRWTFSFRYWRQIENFGLGDCRPSWYTSFLDRLSGLSAVEIEEAFKDRSLSDAIRFHPIDWSAKNIPLERTDIDWIPEEYWKNPVEYPLMQFHVSKALGRVVGFFDEEKTFNIVLLDPNHNMQPSKFNGYAIRPTAIAQSEIMALEACLSAALTARGYGDPSLHSEIRVELQGNYRVYSGGAILVNIGDVHFDKLNGLTEDGIASTYEEVFIAGIDEYEKLRS